MHVKVEEIFEILRGDRPIEESRKLAIELLEEAAKTVRGSEWRVEHQLRALNTTIAALKASSAPEEASGEVLALRSQLAQLEEKIAQKIVAAVAEGHNARFSSELMSAAIEDYKQKVGNELDGKHANDVHGRLDFFLQAVGDLPLRELTRKHIEDFRDLLDRLPEKWRQRFPGLDPKTAIERNAGRARPFQSIKAVTANLKYLGPINRFLQHLVDEGRIERNPAKGIKSARSRREGKKTSANAKRLPLTADQLSAVLAEAAGRSKASAPYWVPIGMLFTGARLNEFCQLRTDDFVEHNGRPHISILCDESEDEQDGAGVSPDGQPTEVERRAKSAAARRLIPVHPVLIDAGFTEFIKSRRGKAGSHAQLFRELTPDKWGYYSNAASKRLNRLIRKAGVRGPRKSVYSLRHNFAAACDAAGMPREIKQKLMGHQLAGVTGVYGNPLPEPHESQWIDKVGFPGVDLSPFSANRQTRK